MLMTVWRHLRTVLVHKYWVMRYCAAAGLWWRGLVHDLSKFTPTEFGEAVRYATGKRSPVTACVEAIGWSAAWLHHVHANDHHAGHWAFTDADGVYAVRPPLPVAVEMLADVLAADRAYWGRRPLNAVRAWRADHAAKLKEPVHPDLAAFLDTAFDVMAAEDTTALLGDHARLTAMYAYTCPTCVRVRTFTA